MPYPFHVQNPLDADGSPEQPKIDTADDYLRPFFATSEEYKAHELDPLSRDYGFSPVGGSYQQNDVALQRFCIGNFSPVENFYRRHMVVRAAPTNKVAALKEKQDASMRRWCSTPAELLEYADGQGEGQGQGTFERRKERKIDLNARFNKVGLTFGFTYLQFENIPRLVGIDEFGDEVFRRTVEEYRKLKRTPYAKKVDPATGEVLETGSVWSVFISEAFNGSCYEKRFMRRQAIDGAEALSMDPDNYEDIDHKRYGLIPKALQAQCMPIVVYCQSYAVLRMFNRFIAKFGVSICMYFTLVLTYGPYNNGAGRYTFAYCDSIHADYYRPRDVDNTCRRMLDLTWLKRDTVTLVWVIAHPFIDLLERWWVNGILTQGYGFLNPSYGQYIGEWSCGWYRHWMATAQLAIQALVFNWHTQVYGALFLFNFDYNGIQDT